MQLNLTILLNYLYGVFTAPEWLWTWEADYDNHLGLIHICYKLLEEALDNIEWSNIQFNLYLFITIYEKTYGAMCSKLFKGEKIDWRVDRMELFKKLARIGFHAYPNGHKTAIMKYYANRISFERNPQLYKDFTKEDALEISKKDGNKTEIFEENIKSMINRGFLEK